METHEVSVELLNFQSPFNRVKECYNLRWYGLKVGILAFSPLLIGSRNVTI